MVTRERDQSQQNYVKSTTVSQKQFNVIKLTEQSTRTLEQELQGYRDEAQKMRKVKALFEGRSFTAWKRSAMCEKMKLGDGNKLQILMSTS